MPHVISQHPRCQIASKAELQKAFSESLIPPEPGALCARKRNPSCKLEDSELCYLHGVLNELLHPQKGSAAEVTLLPGAREVTCHKKEGVTGKSAGSEDLEERICTSDSSARELLVTHLPQEQEATHDKQEGVTAESAGSEDLEERICTSVRSARELLAAQDRSATRNKQESTLRGFLAPLDWIRSHPMLTLVMFLLLLLALGVSLAVVSGGGHRETPVTPVTADTPLLLACPHGWVGHRGICYFLSRDQLSWDQAQARCSELGASLAVLQDWEMEFLLRLTRNKDHWIGLCRWDQELQWVDGSSFNSSFPVLGNAGCVFLGEDNLRSEICSSEMSFICSRPQTHL
ncbi:C-type lectin domain family 2 member D-related protein-like [Malurus melanocephalus]|uniref:C-type lectin domain family 2 member D-related protein-like n=1 Tax=Malurus melanocephalus TaxID=175006 RepID=UPI002548FFAD|nr:C-type lectin domain family 2 member D-related protein-like [Malurus melanocephalus]XP_057244287.1 C-type lectin domain family 2 member D-related protein-like [Malurus melanocephalus]